MRQRQNEKSRTEEEEEEEEEEVQSRHSEGGRGARGQSRCSIIGVTTLGGTCTCQYHVNSKDRTLEMELFCMLFGLCLPNVTTVGI